MKHCQYCKKPNPPSRQNRKYCGDPCRNKYNNLKKGQKARDDGIALVILNNQEFVATMKSVARRIARRSDRVSIDDLRLYAQKKNIIPHHPNAWGPIFHGKEWMCLGHKQSAFASNHAREIKIWCLAA